MEEEEDARVASKKSRKARFHFGGEGDNEGSSDEEDEEEDEEEENEDDNDNDEDMDSGEVRKKRLDWTRIWLEFPGILLGLV